MATPRRSLVLIVVAQVVAFLAGCEPTTQINAVATAPPPPPRSEPKPVRTYDYTHKLVVSPRHRLGRRFTVAILRFGDTKDVEDQPFGRNTDEPADAAKNGSEVSVNIKIGDAGRQSPPTQERPRMNKRGRDILKHELVNSDAFVVVERERILDILREVKLGKSEYADPETSPDEGRLISVQYLIEGSMGPNEDMTLKDALDAGNNYRDAAAYRPSFLENIFSRGKVNRRKRYQQIQRMRAERLRRERIVRTYDTACYLSVYDVHTGQVVCTVMGLGRNGLEAIKDGVQELIDEMPDRVGDGVRVASVSGDKVYLDVGARGGLKEGTKFQIEHRGQPIRDRHGTIIGYERSEAAEVEVTAVKDLYSIAKVLHKAGEVLRGDLAVPAKH